MGRGGGASVRSLGAMSFTFMQFSAKFWQNSRLAPLQIFGIGVPSQRNPGSATAMVDFQ